MTTHLTEKSTFDAESFVEKCPAFKDGCPYSKLTQELFMEELKKCPEFKVGCPFKDAKNVKEVLEELSKMPETKHHQEPAHEQLLGMLRSIHSVSKGLEGKIGECPVFKTEDGCPFKDASKEGKPLVEPPTAVLTVSDLTKLKEQCPAFKEGCPFAEISNDLLFKEIKNCPEFKDGCAFKDAKSVEDIQMKLAEIPNTGEKACHHREVLLETMKLIHGLKYSKTSDCPVFQKDGCPFKSAESGGHPLVEPAVAVLPEKQNRGMEGDNPDLQGINVLGLKETCPAFENGCPFAKIGNKGELEKCPEFKEGCPHKTSDNMTDIYDKLSKMPGFSLEGSHGAKVLEMLTQVHEISKQLTESMGECPVFAEQGCPFKTVCNDGQPLIEKLDIQRWTKVLESSIDSIMESAEAEGVLLSKELKQGTKKVHREAENVHFIREFVKGRIEKQWYKVLLADLYFIYSALEEENAKHANHPLFKAIHFPKELNRGQLLEEDLEFYYGPDWKEQIEISPATEEYVNRLREVSSQDPSLLIAHHYSRYLGDLSGGQILKKMVKKALDLPQSGEGVRFYDFDHVPEAKKFKNMYRSNLDKLGIGKEKADEIVNEANAAFLLNIRVFKEIDVLAGFENPEPQKPKKEVDGSEVDGKAKQSDQCPFAAMARKASPQKDQVVVPVESTMTNPLVWAVVVAVMAILLGLLVVKLL